MSTSVLVLLCSITGQSACAHEGTVCAYAFSTGKVWKAETLIIGINCTCEHVAHLHRVDDILVPNFPSYRGLICTGL